jgi:L-threonylcarbamoyladenylate synthase
VLAIPTESSYALAADPASAAGVAAVYRMKGRDAGKPLPVVASGLDQLAGLGIDPDLPILVRLARVWPAPVSVLVPLTRPLPAAAGAGTLAVRIPAQPRLRSLLAALGTALTATSANKSGGEPALTAAEAAAVVAGEDAVVVDSGALPGGPPSTLVEWTPAGLVVLRHGSFPAGRLREALAEGWKAEEAG